MVVEEQAWLSVGLISDSNTTLMYSSELEQRMAEIRSGSLKKCRDIIDYRFCLNQDLRVTSPGQADSYEDWAISVTPSDLQAMRKSHRMEMPTTMPRTRTGSPCVSGSVVILTWLLSTLLMSSPVIAQAAFSPYLYGTNNYLSASLYNDMWWMQGQCHWGVIGTRSSSVYQCGTFSCPTLWYSQSQYQCPPLTLYSNSLQRCVRPSTLARVKRCERTN